MPSARAVFVLSFFVCLGYTALNETAAELEHPFGLGANHLQLTAYQRQFNSKLAHLFDQTIPTLGYLPKSNVPMAAGARTGSPAAHAATGCACDASAPAAPRQQSGKPAVLVESTTPSSSSEPVNAAEDVPAGTERGGTGAAGSPAHERGGTGGATNAN